jgi:hypothetical protein
VLKEEISISKVMKLTTIITLNEGYRQKQVDGNIALKVKKNIMNIGFVTKGKRPDKVSIII